MKPRQAALLIGMAAMDCLAVAAGIALAAGSIGASGLATTPGGEARVSPLPTNPPATLASAFPSLSPRGGTDSIPVSSPPSAEAAGDWRIFSVPEAEISLPATYAAGDPHAEAAAIVESLREMGANFDWPAIEERLAAADESYVLWGIDSRQGNPAVVTNVAIAFDVPAAGESLADYASRFLAAVAEDYELIERRSIPHAAYEAERLLLLARGAGEARNQMAMYLLRNGKLMWGIFCYTSADETAARLPEFDRMAGSFRVRSSPH